MFSCDIYLEKDIARIAEGKCSAPEGYKLSNDKKSLVRKTEEEILADDWDTSIERKCEYRDYLTGSINDMEIYLADTDWYVSRKAETDKEIPGDVLTTRTEYREKISDFRKRLGEIPEDK